VLVEKATELLKKRQSSISSVSAGLRTPGGKEYYGVCIDLENSTTGMCAEHSAIGMIVSEIPSE
jgi:cytidine deaminase